MALALTSISPEAVTAEGGVLLTLTGDFSGFLGTALRVHVGPNGNDTDPECYSGVVGQGNDIYPGSVTVMRCYLPTLDPTTGTPYKVFIERSDGGADNALLAAALTVRSSQYFSKVFELRSVFPRFYRMGPRNMDALEPLP